MTKTWLTVAFIAAVSAAGVLIGTRTTVADGRVMAANLYEEIHSKPQGKGLDRVECDPEIPIGHYGAVFHCTLHGDDGSTAKLEYHMKRDGSLEPRLLDTTPPTMHRAPARGDAWE
ncbi:MAG TPA: hypothetical protein VFQ53_39780 [Kofleriaceae bacterium]|nr:hypothetical protein [Kofleriaceae bacterium]